MIELPEMPPEFLPVGRRNGSQPRIFSDGADQLRVGEYLLKSLKRNDSDSCLIFPKFVDRAVGFIVRYQTETDAAWLTTILFSNFQAASPEVLMLAALDQEGTIVAHLIAKTEMYAGQTVGYVMQVDKDEGIQGLDIMETGWEIVKEWCAENKLKRLFNWGLNEKVMRIWRSQYGFTVHRYLMVREMEE